MISKRSQKERNTYQMLNQNLGQLVPVTDRSSHNRRANIACEANNHYERSTSHEFCYDSSSLKESQVILNGTSPGDQGCNKD